MKRFTFGDVRVYVWPVPAYYRSLGVRRLHRTGGVHHCLTVRPWSWIVDVCRG